MNKLIIVLSFFLSCLSYAESDAILNKVEKLSYIRSAEKTEVIKGTNPVYLFEFKNGLRLVVLSDYRNPLAKFRSFFYAGSNQEKKGKTGIAHFFEHMMFRKTKNHPEGHYDKVVSSIGGQANAYTTKELVSYVTTFPAPALDVILKLEYDRLTKLDLRKKYFKKEKGAILSERSLRVENNPWQRAMEFMNFNTEKETQYEWLTIGTKKDIENMSIKDAKSFYNLYYTPDNAIFLIGGPYDVYETVVKVHKKFKNWKGKTAYKKVILPDNYLTRNIGKKFECSEMVSQKVYSLVFPKKYDLYKDEAILNFLNYLINYYKSGTLERRLIKKNHAIGFNFGWSGNDRLSTLKTVFSFKLSPDQEVDNAKEMLFSELGQVKKVDINEHKKYIMKSVKYLNLKAALKMSTLLDFSGTILSSGYPLDHLQRLIQSIKDLTQDEFEVWIDNNLLQKKFYVESINLPGKGGKCENF